MLKIAFLRNILLLSVLIAFSLPVYDAYFILPSYEGLLIEQTEEEAVRYGKYLIRTLQLDGIQIGRDNIPKDIRQDVGIMRQDRQLIKLRVFSAAGEIVFSTKAEELGKINQKDYFINIVAKGDNYSKVVEKDRQTADGAHMLIDVVETYVPIMAADGFHGAIEVYYDITQALGKVNSLTHRSNMILLLIALGLLISIIVALRKAYLSIQSQQQTEALLVKTNEELEVRVAERTHELKRSNIDLEAEVEQHLLTTNELQKANSYNRTVINSMNDAVAIIDAATFEIVDFNKVFLADLDYSPEDICGRTCYKVTHELDAPCAAPDHICPLIETVTTGSYAQAEHRHHNIDGKAKFVEVSTSPIFDEDNKVTQVVHVCRDITERKLAEEEILHMAYYDALTGLPNRRLLIDRLNQAISQAKRDQHKLALLFLDLDRFKDINDTRGHSCGDEVLKNISERLKGCTRESDTLARLGGDEFIILMPHIETEMDATRLAEKVLTLTQEVIPLSECQIHITTSVGISVFPNDGADSEILLKNSDMALYAAKSRGRNNFKYFSEKMNSQAQERHELENRIHRGLENNEFHLAYQPQMNLKTGEFVGVEALARWVDPVEGFVSPGKFIPVAEDTGLIVPLGDWILRTACEQAVNWQRQGFANRFVGVNISARQFQQPGFVEQIKIILAQTGLAPESLELELTESLLMHNVSDNIKILTELKQMGLKLAIDDFGTGYSSLSYLKNFPIDRIKIDQSFVRDINNNDNDLAIVETIIAMAERLELEVIAEGVEDEQQLLTLQSRNCHLIQGYLVAKPMAAADLENFLRENASDGGEEYWADRPVVGG